MSLSLLIDTLIANGGTLEQVQAIVRAHEAIEEEAKAKKREADAERQRRHRMSRGVTVTNSDNCDEKVASLTPKEIPPTPPKEITPLPTIQKFAVETRANPNDFEIWWKIYPHKVGKDAAQKSFNTARKLTSLEILLDGVRQYIANKPPDRNWCNPATWLNQGRWKDEPAPSEHRTQTGANGSKSLSAAIDRLDARINGRANHVAERFDDELPFDGGGGLPGFAGGYR